MNRKLENAPTLPPTIRTRITGEIFTKQRFGGVSRYCVELASELNRLELAHARIDANAHVNEHLWQARTEVRNEGYYFNRSTKNTRRVSGVAQRVKRHFAAGDCNEIQHASYYGHENFYRRGLATVTTFYDMIHERYGPDPVFHERKRRCLHMSDRCIAISEATKADMVHYLDADPGKIDVVYLASRVTLPEGAHAEPDNYLLWIGPRGWYKNFQTFVQGYLRSRAAREKVTIVCAGGPPMSSRERESLQQLGLNLQRVRHLQPADDELPSLYARANALVYASLFEGFGIPPLEAMMCNCPVIASEAGSIPEVVGDAALRIQPDSADSIASAIDELLYNSELANDLRRRGREQAAKFSWTRCAQETLDCYHRALHAANRSLCSGPVT